MKRIKTAIIGGGISGLYLAWKLSEKGHDITLFEKEKDIGQNKACSGLFSKRILEYIPQSEKLIQNRINFVEINFPRKKIKVNFSKQFLVMDHSQLDKLVFGLIKKAEIKFGYNINFIPEGFDRIIGCDGANSFVRKSLNVPDPQYRIGILGFTEKQSNQDYVEVWPVKKGFIWEIPRGKETEYGIMTEPKRATKELNNFIEKRNISLKRKNARLIPQGFNIPDNTKITLVGDAAGMTKPWSGGGVVWSLTACNMLVKNFPDFKKYRREARRFFIPKIIFSKSATKIVYFFGFNFPWLLPSENKMESDFLK